MVDTASFARQRRVANDLSCFLDLACSGIAKLTLADYHVRIEGKQLSWRTKLAARVLSVKLAALALSVVLSVRLVTPAFHRHLDNYNCFLTKGTEAALDDLTKGLRGTSCEVIEKTETTTLAIG